jgi:hypothetical protein
MVRMWWSGLSFPFFYFFEREREKRTRGKWLCLLMLSSKFTPLTNKLNGSALEWKVCNQQQTSSLLCNGSAHNGRFKLQTGFRTSHVDALLWNIPIHQMHT